MGIAAYNRGSVAITRQLCMEFGCRGCVVCRPHVPVPRPSGWGSKAAARALDHARRVLSGAAAAGLPTPDEKTLASVVQHRARVGAATASAAAAEGLRLVGIDDEHGAFASRRTRAAD